MTQRGLPHPLEGGHQVEHPGHAGGLELLRDADIGEIQISERPKAMRDRHHYDICGAGQLGAIV